MSSSSFRFVTSVHVKEQVSGFQPAWLHSNLSLAVIVLRALPRVFLKSLGSPSAPLLTSYQRSHTRGCPCILLDTYTHIDLFSRDWPVADGMPRWLPAKTFIPAEAKALPHEGPLALVLKCPSSDAVQQPCRCMQADSWQWRQLALPPGKLPTRN